MRTQLSLRLEHFGFLPRAFLTAQKVLLLPFQLYSCMRPIGWSCGCVKTCLWGHRNMSVHMHVEARCQHRLSSSTTPHLIFWDRFFEPETQHGLADQQAQGICLPQPHLRAGSETTQNTRCSCFLHGTGISSQGLRLPKQARSLPSSPSTPGFLWPWRMFPILLFLPSGSHSLSSAALLPQGGRLHLVPVLRHPRLFPGPHSLSL